MTAPLPANECARLEALKSCHVLDSAPEHGFDDLVHLAAQICQTPMAAISLVDSDRQWFKSRIGLAATETPRSIAFCAHAIVSTSELFVVPDALADPRFADNILVHSEPHIRFYAGMKLVSSDGHPLGTLCIMDREPRELTGTQRESLCRLGRQAAAQLELRRELAAHRANRAKLECSQRQLRELQSIVNESPVVAFLVRAEEGYPVEFLTENVSQWGYGADEFISGRRTYPSVVHPDDLASLAADALHWVDRGINRFRREYRIVTRSGKNRWIAQRTSVRRDEAGKATHLEGVLFDITVQREAQNSVREMAEQYSILVNNLKKVVFQTDATGLWTFLNPAWTEILGFSIEESLGKPFLNYVHPDDRQRNQELFLPVILREKDSCRHEVRYLTSSGDFRWIEVFARLTLDPQGNTLGTSGTLHDVTQRKLVEDKLRESETLYHSLVEHLPLFIIRKDLAGRFTFANRQLAQALQLPADAFIGKTDYDLVPAETADSLRQNDEQVIASGKATEVVREFPEPNGEVRCLQIITTPLYDTQCRIVGVQVISWDVTEQRRSETQLQQSLAEKEILLKEIHHRVKNNMQVISSLLNLQANSTDDPRLRTMVTETQQRIASMALIHEKLYQSRNLARVAFAQYLRELVDNLASVHRDQAQRIAVHIEANDLELGIDTAIPCGLMVNELVSNAFKHAFPGGGSGEIRVKLRRESGGLRVSVSDTGCGLPEGIDFQKTHSLGMKLVSTLVRQLHGTFSWQTRPGTTFSLLLRETVRDQVP